MTFVQVIRKRLEAKRVVCLQVVSISSPTRFLLLRRAIIREELWIILEVLLIKILLVKSAISMLLCCIPLIKGGWRQLAGGWKISGTLFLTFLNSFRVFGLWLISVALFWNGSRPLIGSAREGIHRLLQLDWLGMWVVSVKLCLFSQVLCLWFSLEKIMEFQILQAETLECYFWAFKEHLWWIGFCLKCQLLFVLALPHRLHLQLRQAVWKSKFPLLARFFPALLGLLGMVLLGFD